MNPYTSATTTVTQVATRWFWQKVNIETSAVASHDEIRILTAVVAPKVTHLAGDSSVGHCGLITNHPSW